MRTITITLATFLLLLQACDVLAGEQSSATPAPSVEDAMPLRLGGAGGLYLHASPSPLVVEIAKQDKNSRDIETHLRAILFGPDREVIQEFFIPDDDQPAGSGPGPVQRVRFETQVETAGVYGINITVTNDRYGDHAFWGFTTNCPRYLVETSRGHRDARHEEPIVFDNPEREGDVCFLPREAAISMEVNGLPKDSAPLTLYDSKGALLAEIPVTGDGAATHQVAASARENVPWRLHFPKYRSVVQIDGVTRWDSGSNNLSLWTPEPSSWFSFHPNRWLLTPYKRTVYAQSGQSGTLTFRVHNNGAEGRTVALTLEPDPDARDVFSLSDDRVELGPGKAKEVALQYRMPEGDTGRTCRIRVTPEDDSDFTTYSRVTLRPGVAPATGPIDMPIKLEPYRHENAQFGYLPEYPTANQVYFDPQNRPYVIGDGALWTVREGEWKPLPPKTHDGNIISPQTAKVAFDTAGNAYSIGNVQGKAAYIRLSAGNETFEAFPIPGNGSFDIEQFSGHNTPVSPPPFVRNVRTAKDPNLMWRSLNDLALFLPREEGGGVEVGEPLLLSKKCIGLSSHSGIPSTIVSRGPKVHVVWGEATDPEEKAPGVPTYITTYDRETKALGEPVLIGYGPPANDAHNSPCVTMDSKGFLHVLVGTHGRTFKYAQSFEPNNAYSGWTETTEIGPDLRQTYVGLVCDEEDTLHLVFRLWRTDRTYFPAGHYATLAHMSKRPGEPWSEPQILVVAAFSEYSIFYHRLTIDRQGDLFLSYDYWSTFWFYRTDHWGDRRALLTSSDGKIWKLAGNGDLLP